MKLNKDVFMKKIAIFILSILMLATTTAGAKTLEFTMDSNIMYESDGGIHKTELENAPYTQNGRTMVPVRIISEKFGAEVGWNGETGEVTIKKDDNTIVLTLGKSEAMVNGNAITLDVMPEEKNGRTMVPLRFISETLGMGVGYVQSTRQVLISDEEPIITVNGINLTIEDYRSMLSYLSFVPGMDGETEAIESATNALVQYYATISNLEANSEYDFSEVQELYDIYGEEIYKTSLFAPLAQILENEITIVGTLNSYIETAELDKAAEEYYKENFVRAKHILITFEGRDKNDARIEVQKILSKLEKGEDFDEIMFEVCEDPGIVQYPEGYVFTKGEMVPEFEAAAFELEVGKVSDIVETSYGYHIIKREELPKIDEATNEAIKNFLASNIYADAVNNAIELSSITAHKTTEEISQMLK